jgi:hypothetical protein
MSWRTGEDIARERGLDLDRDQIPAADFAAAGLPLIVACTGCTMTMNVLSANVTDDESVYCADCAGY